MLKAFELSQDLEDNEITSKLSEAKKKELKQKRYTSFKMMLIYVIKGGNAEDYEDFLRSIFGNNAFYMFTMQKILTSTTKILQSISHDSMSKDILKFYTSLLDSS